MATHKAIVKKSELSNFSNPRRKGIWALDVDEGDEVMAARLVKPGQQVMLFTHQGMAVRFDENNVRPMGRMARGVKGATLREENDYLVGCEVVNGEETETVLVVCENGFGKRSSVQDFRQTKRGGVGVRSIVTSDRNGNVVGAVSVTDSDSLVMIASTGQTMRISMLDLRVLGRNTQGVKLVQLRDENATIVAIQKITAADEANAEEATVAGEGVTNSEGVASGEGVTSEEPAEK